MYFVFAIIALSHSCKPIKNTFSYHTLPYLLPEPRQNIVGHGLDVRDIRLAILFRTPLLIADQPMQQQPSQKDQVAVRQHVIKLHRRHPQEREQQLEKVVDMAADTPPAGSEQQARVLGAVGRRVVGGDVGGLLAPDEEAVVLGEVRAEVGALGVNVVLDVDADNAGDEEESGVGGVDLNRLPGKEKAVST